VFNPMRDIFHYLYMSTDKAFKGGIHQIVIKNPIRISLHESSTFYSGFVSIFLTCKKFLKIVNKLLGIFSGFFFI
jgi:hypothetical protein